MPDRPPARLAPTVRSWVRSRTSTGPPLGKLSTTSWPAKAPELLTWVKEYGQSGTKLVAQPEEIWDHPRTDYQMRDDGSAYISVPLWTVDESPSDLTAECELDASGAATIVDVHVL